MRKDNPACYECPKGRNGIHYWCRIENRKAQCEYCKQILSEKDADDAFEENDWPNYD